MTAEAFRLDVGIPPEDLKCYDTTALESLLRQVEFKSGDTPPLVDSEQCTLEGLYATALQIWAENQLTDITKEETAGEYKDSERNSPEESRKLLLKMFYQQRYAIAKRHGNNKAMDIICRLIDELNGITSQEDTVEP
jgi:hypothetical protein